MAGGRRGSVALALAAFAAFPPAACGGGDTDNQIVLATTTSVEESGLLDVLVPAFERATDYEVKTVAGASDEAIALGRDGEADVILVNAPAAEEELMTDEAAGTRSLVMHGDFVVLGPPGDPAGVGSATSAVEALTRIADEEAAFVAGGGGSGARALERRLWDDAGIEPAGDWYEESGEGTAAIVERASEKAAYTISDLATFLASDPAELEVFLEAVPELLDVYHVIDITSAAGEGVDNVGGRAFAQWIVSDPGQDLIETFGASQFGRPLFVADAGKSEDDLLEES